MIKHLLNNGQKKCAILIDPDKVNEQSLLHTIEVASRSEIDMFLIGGSLLQNDTQLDNTVLFLKENSSIPVILFPGGTRQISSYADGILLLSLISGRNADLLIGKQVEAAFQLHNSGLEIIPTGYMLVDGGKSTAVNYISNTLPIPADKPEIAVATALAGTQLGLRCIYLEAGSGAKRTVSEEMVKQVKDSIKTPLFVGGGIRSAEVAQQLSKAGADIIVVGNAAEKNPDLIKEIADAIYQLNEVNEEV